MVTNIIMNDIIKILEEIKTSADDSAEVFKLVDEALSLCNTKIVSSELCDPLKSLKF